MKMIYPKMIIVLVILAVALVMNFRYEAEPVRTPAPAPVVKKVVVIKKVYIRVPVPSDSSQIDTTIITLPKEPLSPPAPDLKKFRKSRNIHKSGFIS